MSESSKSERVGISQLSGEKEIMSEVEKELMPSTPDDPNLNRGTYSTLKTTTTITDTLHDTIDDLDSLIAKRKAELAKRLKDGDKATFV